MGIKRLPKAVSATLVSTSSVQSQVSILKELIENAIDAIGNNDNVNGQIYIEIDRDSAGLDYISVKDNGSGVLKFDRNMMCLNCTTSKLTSMDDLSNGIPTCGFRGEALYFISRLVENMYITTKTKDDVLMETWSVNTSGLPNSDSKTSSGVNGTTIKITGLFKNTPVRYKFLKEKKIKMRKSIENMIVEYAMVYRNIRFQLRYVKAMSNGKITNGECKSYPNKISVSNLIYNIVETRKKDWLFENTFDFEVMDIHTHETFTIVAEVVLPMMRNQDILTTKCNMKILSVNKRPLNLSLKFGKCISSIVNESYSENGLLTPSIWCISVTIPSNKIDVNIEPEKSDVIVCNEQTMFESFKKTLFEIIKKEHSVETASDAINQRDELSVISESVIERGSEREFEIDKEIEKEIEKEITEESKNNMDHQFDDLIRHSVDDNTLVNAEVSAISNDILGSSDDSFLDEIDATLKNINAQSHTNLEKKRDVITESLSNQNNDVKFHHPETEFSKSEKKSTDNLLTSYTSNVYTDIPTTIDPVEIMPTVPEIHKLLNNKNLSLPEVVLTGTTAENPIITSTSESKIDSSFQVLPQTKPLKESNSVKQMDMSSYLTYHIRPEIKKSSQVFTISLPKIIECTQNAHNEVLQTKFEFSLESKKRQRLLIDNEQWIKRPGIPTENLVNAVRKLYEDVAHPPAKDMPSQNEFGIFCLK